MPDARAAMPTIPRSRAAWLLKTPVVSTRSVNDPESMAEAINALLDDPLERSRLGRNAQLAAQEHYSLARMASDTERVYREVLAGA